MATFGLTAAGFVPKTLADDIRPEIEAALRASFGASIDLTPTSNFGQFVGIMSERLAELWEVAQAVNSATDPDKAEDQSQDALCAITGTVREAAKPSTVNMVATGTNGTPLPTGRIAAVVATGTQFRTLIDATLATAATWTASTAYGAGAFVTNGGNVYFCTSGGTSAGSGGPSGTGSSIADNTVTWSYVGGGAAYAVIPSQSVETGPRIAVTGTLTSIVTPLSGWVSVNNVADAVLGRDLERDDELRLRRENELLGASRSTIESIRTRLLEDVPNVEVVIVFQNDTEVTNGAGMPAHSVECLVQGGLDQDVVNTVWANVAAGITTYGNTSGTVVDADNGGQTYTVGYSRPVLKNVYVIANVVKDPEFFPADGATQIANAILAYGQTVLPGKDVVSARLKAACFTVLGVLDVTTCYIGLSASPSSEATVAIALRELAVYDSSRLTVNVSDGTP